MSTYQVAGQLPTVCVCEGNYVVSYYTSQSLPHVHARASSLRTFVQESNRALQFSCSFSTGTRPRYMQIVEHCYYGRC
jgi:hypothetical protein